MTRGSGDCEWKGNGSNSSLGGQIEDTQESNQLKKNTYKEKSMERRRLARKKPHTNREGQHTFGLREQRDKENQLINHPGCTIRVVPHCI